MSPGEAYALFIAVLVLAYRHSHQLDKFLSPGRSADQHIQDILYPNPHAAIFHGPDGPDQWEDWLTANSKCKVPWDEIDCLEKVTNDIRDGRVESGDDVIGRIEEIVDHSRLYCHTVVDWQPIETAMNEVLHYVQTIQRLMEENREGVITAEDVVTADSKKRKVVPQPYGRKTAVANVRLEKEKEQLKEKNEQLEKENGRLMETNIQLMETNTQLMDSNKQKIQRMTQLREETEWQSKDNKQLNLDIERQSKDNKRLKLDIKQLTGDCAKLEEGLAKANQELAKLKEECTDHLHELRDQREAMKKTGKMLLSKAEEPIRIPD